MVNHKSNYIAIGESRMKKFFSSPLLWAVICVLFIIMIPDKWLSPLLTDNKIEDASISLQPSMFEGMAIQTKMLEDNKYLPIYGSSELSRMDYFHPSNYFKVNNEGFTPFLVGRAYAESMFHFLNFAVQKNELKNKKIVFILSPQWFTQTGEDETQFDANFSVLKAYQLALYPTIHNNLMVMASKRMLDYRIVRKDPILTTLFESYADKKQSGMLKSKIATIIGKGYLQLLKRRDLLTSIIDDKKTKLHVSPKVTKGDNWNKLDKNAGMIGKQVATDNPFYIKNSYYNSMIKAKIKKLKGYKRNNSYEISPEYQDFQMMLDVLKEAGAKPLFVSVPVNGYWYDYTGFPKKGRTVYYEKIKKQIEKEGYPVLDLSQHEYDKYFLTDTMHLGYKGWVAMDKGISEFMKKK